jgi:hypothetical protein
MKLTALFLTAGNFVSAKSERGLMWLGERYIYDDPLCEDISYCRGEKGCNAKVFTDREGIIKLQNYESQYSCRWEIKGPSGSTIRVKIDKNNNNFGIENQRACGYDRLHIQSGAGDRLGRFCSHVNDPNKVHNALSVDMAYNNEKIANPVWQAGFVELPFDHLVVAFDSDQETSGQGFKISYEIVAPQNQDHFTEVKETLNIELDQLFKNVLTKPHHIARMEKIHTNLFTKWESLMGRCKNGDMLNSIHASFSADDVTDPAVAQSVWEGLMESSFEVCDLPITRKGFPASSWKRRINRYFDRLNKLIALQ